VTRASLAEALHELDHIFAGFVCKDISACNKSRAKYAAGVSERTGKTGSTYGATLEADRVLQPLRLLLENVRDLAFSLKDESGTPQQPQIQHIEKDLQGKFPAMGWAKSQNAEHGIENSRSRIYIPCTRASDGLSGEPYQADFRDALLALRLREPVVPLKLLLAPEISWPTHVLTEQEQAKIQEAKTKVGTKKKEELAEPGVDAYFGLQNSKAWREVMVDRIPCLRPNSSLYSERLGCILDGKHHLRLVGFTPAQVPALRRANLSDAFSKDLAGNAMAGPQFIANFTASLVAEGTCELGQPREPSQPGRNGKGLQEPSGAAAEFGVQEKGPAASSANAKSSNWKKKSLAASSSATNLGSSAATNVGARNKLSLANTAATKLGVKKRPRAASRAVVQVTKVQMDRPAATAAAKNPSGKKCSECGRDWTSKVFKGVMYWHSKVGGKTLCHRCFQQVKK
jgi:hypothetical protein